MEIKVIETDSPQRKKLAYPLWHNLEESLNWIHNQGITVIGISKTFGWDIGSNLDFLRKHNWIEGIAILENGFDLTPINSLSNLNYIDLYGNGYKGLIDLLPLKKIKQLRIGYSLHNFTHLEQVSSIQILELYNWPHENLQNLSSLENLQWLEINRSPKLKSLKGIDRLNQLYRLKFYSVPKLTDINALKFIAPSLKKLSFELAKKVEGFEVLDQLTNLESFYIYESAPIHSVQFLRKLRSLKYAYIGTEVLDGNVTYLEENGIEYKKVKKYKIT